MRWHLFIILVLIVVLPGVYAENETNSCNGNFEVKPDFLQFGEEFIFKGNGVQYNGKDYTGNLIVTFKSNNESHELFGSVYKGKIEIPGFFSKDVELDSVGDFGVDVSLIKNGASVCRFENIDKFVVSDELLFVAKLDKSQINPGETLKLTGDVNYKDRSLVSSAEVLAIYDGVEHRTALINGEFNFVLSTSADIKSNVHDLNVRVEDEYGNYAEDSFRFFINPIVSEVSLEYEDKDYEPGDKVNIIPKIYDQAGDEFIDNIQIRIYDPEGKRSEDITILSGESFEYEILSSSKAGTWIVRAKFEDIVYEDRFNVRELSQISVELQDQLLVVNNIGNVKYEDPLLISFDDGIKSEEISVRTKINPGELLEVELFREVREGTYKITIKNTGQEFDNVDVIDERSILEKTGDVFLGFTGNVVRSSGSSTSNLTSYIAVGFLVLIVVVVLFFRFRTGGSNIHVDKIINKSESREVIPNGKKKSTYGKMTNKKDIDDFKTRILEDIKEVEKSSEKKEENEKVKVENVGKPWRNVKNNKYEFRDKKYGVNKEHEDYLKSLDLDDKSEIKKEEKKFPENKDLFKMFD